MVSSLCLNSCAAVPRAAKQTLSSLMLLHKFPSSLCHKYCISKTSASLSVSIIDKKELRSTDLVALEYADLNLTDKISQVPSILNFFHHNGSSGFSLLIINSSSFYDNGGFPPPSFIRLQELGHVRIRQHVNPLSSSFSVSYL